MASVVKRRWTKPDGTTGEGWQVRYLDKATGKRPSKTFAFKKEADAFLRKVERELDDGTHTAAGSTKTVAATADDLVKHYNQRVREGTVGRTWALSVEQFCRCHIVPALGNLKLASLTFADVERFRNALIAKRLSPVTVKQAMQITRMIEDYGRRRGHTKLTIVRDVMGEAPAGKARPIAVPSPSEMQRIAKAAMSPARGHTARSNAFMAIMVAAASVCGLRYGELVGLRLIDVDIENRVLEVRQSVTRLGEIKGPKSAAGVRDVPMPAYLAEMFRAWIETFYVFNPGQIVLTTSNGSPPEGQQLSEYLLGAVVEARGLARHGRQAVPFPLAAPFRGQHDDKPQPAPHRRCEHDGSFQIRYDAAGLRPPDRRRNAPR
ncbi:tyrosine-type recombinase/integrase [Sphingomonas sp. CFBP9021]|nr:tyrosine-type recombinase/integrase [Sphingomonas sp. CFBP9021]MDY0966959.1 tyrosine-type recombinase/integrase [Sphingomonas sp. CFBP9021]